jgi:hypothetical protein
VPEEIKPDLLNSPLSAVPEAPLRGPSIVGFGLLFLRKIFAEIRTAACSANPVYPVYLPEIADGTAE